MTRAVTMGLFDLLRPLAEANPHAVVVIDARRVIAVSNAGAARAFQYAPEELAGLPVDRLIAEHCRPRFDALVEAAAENPARIAAGHGLFSGVCKDGTEVPVEIGVSELPASVGKFCVVTIVDVSDRLRAEQALRDTEANYQSLVESLPLNVFCKDLQGRFTFVNQRFCDTVNRERSTLPGKTDFDLFPRPLAEKYVRDDRRVIETGEPFDDVEEHREAEGTTYVQVWKAPMKDARGAIVGIQGMFWDVTEKKRAEDQRKESEARKRAIFEAALDCIITVDQDNRIIEFNRAAERTFGYRRDEVLGQQIDGLLFPASSQERYHSNLDRYSQRHEEGSLVGKRHEIPVRRKNGTQFVAEMAMQPIPMQGTTAFTVFLRDVTERRRAEDALRRSDARFRSLVKSNIIGIMICRLDGQITEANEAFLRTVGYSRDELLSGTIRWDVITPPEYREADESAIRQLRVSGQCTPWEKEYIRRDGRRVPVLLGVAMLEGSRNHCVCFVLDMTAQKQQERELQAAKEAADAASKAKSAFLASMSHEIRTPIHAILGATDLVLDTRLTNDQREYLQIAKDSGESLLSLINDVLDFSKIEAGRLDLDEREFGLRDAIGGTLKSLAVQAHARNLELVADIRPNVPDRVLGDVIHFRQVLVNLIANAIKFTERGEVVVQAEAASIEGDNVELHVSVRDTGIGIPEKDRQRVFDPFEQLDNTMRRKVSGTGLGLAISSRLVQSMQGRIWCDSEVGRGTTFHFTARLRRPAPAEGSEAEPAAEALRGLNALIVDDNAACRQALTDMFLCWETQATALPDPALARTALEQAAANGRPFDLVLIDAKMPGSDAFSFAREVRERFSIPDTRILMLLTSGDGSGDVCRCEEFGFPAYLMKPINQSELFDTLMALLLGDAAPAANHAREGLDEPSQALTGLQVLLTEDSLYNQKLAMAVLAKRGHRVAVANNGREAVAAAKKRKFDVVLMDVQMPEMDGLEATRLIRLWEGGGEHVPIIAMTAQALKGDREKCLEAGMDEYLSKPVRAHDLHATIERLVGAAHARRVAEGNSGPATTNGSNGNGAPREPLPPRGSPGLNRRRVDWSIALDGVDGDEGLLREVSEAFCEEAPIRLRDLKEAAAAGDARLFERSAHTLKGGLRFFGAFDAAEIAVRLEMASKSGKMEGNEALLEELNAEVQHVLGEVRSWLGEAVPGQVE